LSQSKLKLPQNQYMSLFRWMVLSRGIDAAELNLVQRGEAHFHVSGAGHESTAAAAFYLEPHDFLHLHYRDKALLIGRGLPLAEFFRSLLATHNSHSTGRQMSAHMSWPALNVTSLVGPVGNNALHAVGTAAALKSRKTNGVAFCAVGDGTTQQGEFLEAVAEADRLVVPVLFLVEDNGLAISTRTKGQTFFDGKEGGRDRLFGVPIVRFDGSDPIETANSIGSAISQMRNDRAPKILLGKFERLSDHTNSDDQSAYRTTNEIKAAKFFDPIERLRQYLTNNGEHEDDLRRIETQCLQSITDAILFSRTKTAGHQQFGERAALPDFIAENRPVDSHHGASFSTIRQAINSVLHANLSSNERIVIIGQDIEDPKGDVFGITKGLSTAFEGRVLNASLSESTIVGTAIGRAMAGQRPIACIQFADFLPLAANQIISELSTLYWRTNGGWSAPVVIMAPIGGYKPGLGPFHAESYEAMFSQCPGLNVVCPSTAEDAGGMLNAALSINQPTLFLYPKALLNRRELNLPTTPRQAFVVPGRAKRIVRGDDLTLVAWGNTVPICEDVVELIAQYGKSVDLIDLRSLSPWDKPTILESAQRTGHLIIAHEDRKSFGIGAEISATIAETLGANVKIKRVARADTYIPFNFEDQIKVLPSFKSILEACAGFLHLEVEWNVSQSSDAFNIIAAVGSGPADDFVRVIELLIADNTQVKEGDLLAVVEASKSAVEIRSQRSGVIDAVLCSVGEEIAVGKPLARWVEQKLDGNDPSVLEQTKVAELKPKTRAQSNSQIKNLAQDIVVSDIVVVGGDRRVTTEELCRNWPTRSTAELIRMTGIRTRQWMGPNQTAFSMAAKAYSSLLERNTVDAAKIGLVIATTGTPELVTPSLAARVSAVSGLSDLATYDLNAACSGYLFAIQAVHDYLNHNPNRTAIVVTAEALSPLLNLEDPDTAVLFGDAATATLFSLTKDHSPAKGVAVVQRPLISGRPESGELLRVPLSGSGYITMNGKAVFSEAVRTMEALVLDACDRSGISSQALDFIVPHQANQRILDAIERRVGVPVVSNIEHWGNTSSCTIPIALQHLLTNCTNEATIALAAFGGGLTSSAAIARIILQKV
jgi:2-oxoisovalerate dehydrogenase E1 component